MFTCDYALSIIWEKRGASTFPLDNLTRVSMASFSRYISALGGFGGPEKD